MKPKLTLTSVILSLVVTAPAFARADYSVDAKGLPVGATLGDFSEVAYTGYRLTHHVQNMIEHYEEYGFNTFAHPPIADHSFFVITPALDHFYSKALLDVSGGPVVIETPERDERYASLQIFDLEHYTKYAERIPGQSGRYVIVREDYQGELPQGEDIIDVIRVNTSYPFALIRTQSFDLNNDKYAGQQRRGYKTIPSVEPKPLSPAPDKNSPAELIRFVADNSNLYQGSSGYVLNAAASYDTSEHQATFDHLYGYLMSGEVINNTGMFEDIDDKDGGSNKMRAAGTLLGHLGFPVYHAYYESVPVFRNGTPLSGKAGDFSVTIPYQPGTNEFWSVTRYDAATRLPVDPEKIGGHTEQVFNQFNTKPDSQGNVTMTFSTKDPKDGSYWMPVTEENYYLVFRYYGPTAKLNGNGALDIIYGDTPLSEKLKSAHFEN